MTAVADPPAGPSTRPAAGPSATPGRSAVGRLVRRRRASASRVDPVQRRHRRALLLVLALVPIAFLDLKFTYQLTGVAWLVDLAVVAPLALLEPVDARVLRKVAPYLAFLALACLSLAWTPDLFRGVATLLQLFVPLPVYLLAARVRDPATFLKQASRICTAAIGLAGLLTVATLANALPAALPLSPRPMAIGLIVLFVIASLGAGRQRTAILGAATLLIGVTTGARTASAVALLMIILSPAWRLRWRGRTALALIGLVSVLAFSRTAAFQDRFFFGEQGTLTDALTGSSSLNTAGRRELWPKLTQDCGQTPVLGQGLGAASGLAYEYTYGVLSQPHNDYLRTYCDVGYVGSVPFWGFFLLSAGGGLTLARRGRPVGAAAGQLVLALLLLAITDNPLVYTAHFMAPTALILGFAAAERAGPRRPGVVPGGPRRAALPALPAQQPPA